MHYWGHLNKVNVVRGMGRKWDRSVLKRKESVKGKNHLPKKRLKK